MRSFLLVEDVLVCPSVHLRRSLLYLRAHAFYALVAAVALQLVQALLSEALLACADALGEFHWLTTNARTFRRVASPVARAL